MIRLTSWLIALTAVALLAGCESKEADNKSNPTGVATLSSPYDVGPRAGELPVASALADKGALLFKTKGCSACHAFGRRLTCPDLKGVTMRRTADWMEHQILQPDVMTKDDPISHQLLQTYVTQMPNLHLTQDEARQVIEYFKQQDHALGVIQ
jgi:cytochrome c551/c552